MIGEGLASSNQRRHQFVQDRTPVGFFTDPTVCIGCKACEVACKEWNEVPEQPGTRAAHSYDHTGALGASSWRHVLFLEENQARRGAARNEESGGSDPFRWVFLSDVCKHCEEAGCLEACPTGSIVRTEVGAVFVQDDICNGCGYCVVSCPFGVIDRRSKGQPGAGGAFKCTFCYDRQASGLVPACAKVCPTESIRFGPLEEMGSLASRRVAELRADGFSDARLYNPSETSVRGIHAMFLLLGEPEAYGLPPKPEAPTVYLKDAWASAGLTSVGAIVAIAIGFLFFG